MFTKDSQSISSGPHHQERAQVASSAAYYLFYMPYFGLFHYVIGVSLITFNHYKHYFKIFDICWRMCSVLSYSSGQY